MSSNFEFSFRTRQAAWDQLKNNPNKILNAVIVGGGIVGAGVLRSFALRGVPDVFLFEKNDFASGTSGASSKLIHAGIRYLEQSWTRIKKGDIAGAWRNLRFVIDASSERRTLGEMAPHLIKPKPIYLILGEGDPRSVASVAAGVWFYYAIQIIQGQFFRPPRMVFRKEAIRWVAPDLDASKVKAIFSFWDSETDDARLVIENLQSAVQNGGHALNYVEMTRYKKENEAVEVELRNNETGDLVRVRTRFFINAAGAFIDDIRRRQEGSSVSGALVDRVAGSHLNVFPAITAESFYITAKDARLVFILKRNEDGLVYTRIGTTERPLAPQEPSDAPQATPAEKDYLTAAVKEFFPTIRLDDSNIVNADAGIRPLRAQETTRAFQKSREHDILIDGRVCHVVGVKLTDYRRVSVELMGKIAWRELGIPGPELVSDERSLRVEASAKLYDEDSLEEIVSKTCVLRWEDYFYRRRGLNPQVEAKLFPEESRRKRQEIERLLKDR